MAFTAPITRQDAIDGMRNVVGTYASTGGSTGGAIVTGLSNILFWNAVSSTSTPSVYGTVSGGTITLTTTANQTGYWLAQGF